MKRTAICRRAAKPAHEAAMALCWGAAYQKPAETSAKTATSISNQGFTVQMSIVWFPAALGGIMAVTSSPASSAKRGASSSADEMKKAVEPYEADQDEIDRDNIVQQPRHEQN